MKILFDTNVILDTLLDREPFSKTSTALIAKVEDGTIAGLMSATTLTTIHYLAAKVIGTWPARDEIRKLLSLFEVAAVNRTVVDRALESKITDFEDAVLLEAARHAGADALVTRNGQDFKADKFAIYTPTDLLRAVTALGGPIS